MSDTMIRLDAAFHAGPVDPRIFGGFLEHLGRAVYEGVYDPGSPRAGADGLRGDVLEALGRMRMTVMRYPGGNFASGYHWMDGVGPHGARPVVRELAWQSREPNTFGTDEFMGLCRRMGWAPMLTVNLGTGTPEEARNWVEYCNSPAGTRYADLRAAHGRAEPHAVGLWCLGNELDGPWQLGHVPAHEYALRAQQAAMMMKAVDPRIEVVACGSCSPDLATYMEWDREVLERLGDLADFVSLHRYVGNGRGDTEDYLAVGAAIDRQIEEMDAVCRFVQARRRSRKRAYLCFDEWNVWYRNRESDGRGTVAPHLLEEVYNLEDALVVAQFLNSFVRHADVVKIANLAQIVNVIAPVVTRGPELLVQSILYPFEMIASRREGVALRVAVEGPEYESRTHGRVPVVDASAILGEGRLHLFAVNRSAQPARVRVRTAGFDVVRVESAQLLGGPDPKAANSFENRDAVRAVAFDGLAATGGGAELELPARSFVAATMGAA